MTDNAVEIAIVKQSLQDFKERYERDQAEFKAEYKTDQLKADTHRSEIMKRLDDLNNKEQQAIGAMKMARVGYWVLGLAVTVLSAIGLPKVAAWLISLAR